MSFLTPAISMGSRYKLVRRKSRTGKLVQETGWINNLITNFGMNTIPITSGQPVSLSVGESNASPSVTDMNLGSRVATASLSSNPETSIDVPNRQAVARHSATFPSGSAAGNLAEIGMTTSTSPYNASTRALITDEFGDPTVITVLPDEDLVVFVEFRIDQPTGDFTGTVDGLDYLVRAAYVDNVLVSSGTGAQRGWDIGNWRQVWSLRSYSSTSGNFLSARTSPNGVGDITSGPSGLRSATTYQDELLPYTNDSHTRVHRLRYLAGQLTGQPIRSITYNIGPTCWQMEFGQDLVKGELEALRIDFRLSWARP